MDILDLNAVEVGAAVGHLAASQAFMMLTGGVLASVYRGHWFGDPANDDAEAFLLDAGAYVVTRQTGGETLFIRTLMGNHAAGFETGQYADLAFERRLAFELFCSTCLAVARPIVAAQDAARQNRLTEAAETAPLKREDSIFEEQPGLSDILPHAAHLVKGQILTGDQHEEKPATECEDASAQAGEDPAGQAAFREDGTDDAGQADGAGQAGVLSVGAIDATGPALEQQDNGPTGEALSDVMLADVTLADVTAEPKSPDVPKPKKRK